MGQRRKLRDEDWLSDLALYEAQFGFFADIDEMIHTETLAKAREERYRAKRERNSVKARRIHLRLNRVLAFDPWKHTADIKPDVFGDNHERIEAVKELANKRGRIAWVLWCMYHHWMFNVLAPGARPYGNKYSKHRRLWFKYHDEVQERARQARWDKKRKRVRNRRNKVKLDKRRGYTVEETLDRLKVPLQQLIARVEEPEEIETYGSIESITETQGQTDAEWYS